VSPATAVFSIWVEPVLVSMVGALSLCSTEQALDIQAIIMMTGSADFTVRPPQLQVGPVHCHKFVPGQNVPG
jgi:hypothetical protein